MLIIPAIDLKEGKVVRLLRGDFSKETVYGSDPLEVARQWQALGAQRLHVVDLDGALHGKPAHAGVIGGIAQALKIPVQTGGGIRSVEQIEQYLAAGVERVILGTKACLDEAFMARALSLYGDRVAAGVDVKAGKVAVKGWVESQALEAGAVVGRLVSQGVKTLIYTEISRDGTLAGPALKTYQRILKQVGGKLFFIASGGVGSLEDLLALKGLEPAGLGGVIVGRALYDGKVDLKAALEACA